MKSPVAFTILHHAITIFIGLSTIICIFGSTLREVIFIDEVIACIIGWIDVNHLDLAEICFPQELQGIEIVALDVDIFAINVPPRCTIATDRLFFVKTQRLGNGLIREQNRLPLIRPGELVALLVTVYDHCIDFLHQDVFINRTNDISCFINRLRHSVRKQCCQLLVVLLCQIWCMHLKLLHV